MMKPIFVIVMFFVGLVCAFSVDNDEDMTAHNQPVITGGWNKIDSTELDEVLISFVNNYLDEYIAQTCTADKETVLTIERAWTQLVQGRKYLLAYRVTPQEIYETDENNSIENGVVPPMLGLLIVWRNINGEITVEKDYSHSAVFDFIELMLAVEKKERYANWLEIIKSMSFFTLY